MMATTAKKGPKSEKPRTIDLVNEMNNTERKALLAYLIGALRGEPQFDQLLQSGIGFVLGATRKRSA